MEIGKMLRQKRTDLNLTQEDIAKQFNVTRQTVSRWENELSYPNIDTLVELSIFFEFSLDEILRGDSVMVKDFAQKVNMSKKYKGWKIATLCLIVLISIFVLNYFSPSMDIGNGDVDSVTVTKSKVIGPLTEFEARVLVDGTLYAKGKMTFTQILKSQIYGSEE